MRALSTSWELEQGMYRRPFLMALPAMMPARLLTSDPPCTPKDTCSLILSARAHANDAGWCSPRGREAGEKGGVKVGVGEPKGARFTCQTTLMTTAV